MAAVNLGTGVLPGSDASLKDEVSGEAILAGQIVYREVTTKKIKLASTASAEKADVTGVAMSSAPTAGQIIKVQWDGEVTGTATLVVGEPYFACETAGNVQPAADIGANEFMCFVGFASAANKLKLGIFAGSVAHA
jgi:hypothetical protein